MLTYAQKLRDPRWQKLRLKIFERDNFTCRFCGSTKDELQVHHIQYLKDTEPWEYGEIFLITACHKCHELETDIAPSEQKETIAGLVQFGFCYADFAKLNYLFEIDTDGKIKSKFREFIFSLYQSVKKDA